MVKKKQKMATDEWIYGIIAELAFFAFLFYVQMLLGVRGNLWISTIILWTLVNIAIIACPLTRKCCCCR